ncbi:30S ribosomal protein S12 methylthiotransferase RimO [Granulicella sp. 5B5]|uniref:30S ribosomal protein S12 methylthiotransferase RimO n=1 Tax=Granulicella sp. 5B5 TaxID=1617967 RepID=UPI002101D7F0|nr:30S ribosomal protein S12 methylthiotransferase RimO [Granulicella sp. 5B5]
MSNTPTLEIPTAPETEFYRPKVGFVSLGCPKNLVDSEVMMGLLHRSGAELTPRAEDAEILVVNTCSFIDSAKQESVDTILEMVQHKIANGGRAQRLIVAGCLVERYRDEIRKNIPEVDAVVGTGELEAILEAAGLNRPAPAENNSPFAILTSAQIERHASSVNQHSRPEGDSPQLRHEAESSSLSSIPYSLSPASRAEGDAREQAGRFSREAWDGATAALPSYLYSDETPRILTTPRASAYIKIAEGCDHPCSFCIIPQLRGKFRSRPIASIVAEAKSLIAQGVREITLIGQDTTCYGEDLLPSIPLHTHEVSSRPKRSEAERPAVGTATNLRRPELADLLEALAPLPGLKWLRFLYAYPNKITTRLLETIARHDTIAKYLDVPLQHASASVLRRMKRGGSADRFLQIIDKARATVPGLVLRTSFIVGFPGETEEDFAELMTFVEAARIDWLGVFSYSDEEGAGAFALDQKVPKRTIESRRKKLMKLQQKISKRARAAWVGCELDILVEGESEETELLWQGRSLEMAPEIDGKVLINDFGPHESLVPGTFYRAEITESHDYDVVARIIE